MAEMNRVGSIHGLGWVGFDFGRNFGK